MTKKEFKIYTSRESKSVPRNMIMVKNKFGWLFLTMEGAQWFTNHTNTFNGDSKETDEEAIKSIVEQIKINADLVKI